MPPKAKEKEQDVTGTKPRWTIQELLANKHLGPAIIGEEMYAASQAAARENGNGVFGPALLGK